MEFKFIFKIFNFSFCRSSRIYYSENFSSIVKSKGLVYYWPIWGFVSELVSEVVLENGIAVSLTTDRFGFKDSAIKFNYGSYKICSNLFFNSNFTLLVWVKLNNYSYSSKLFELFISDIEYEKDRIVFALSDQTTGKPYMRINNSTGNFKPVLFANESLPTGEWRFVSYVLNNGMASIFINGRIVANGPCLSPAKINRTKSYFGMGRPSTNDQSLNADIDDLKIFDRSLSIEEIIQEMNSISSVNVV